MIRRCRASLAALFCLLAAPTAARSAEIVGEALRDSTGDQARTLDCGLQVVTRSIPGATHVALTVAFPVGEDHDPPRREGLARLLAELYFTSAAGYVPERTRMELDHLRPGGWAVQVSATVTTFTEVATPAQLPEVLHQALERLQGVQVTGARLSAARDAVRGDLAELHFANPKTALHYEAGAIARGASSEDILRVAEGRGIAGVGIGEVRQRLERHYGPAVAVLSVAGDWSGIDLADLVRKLAAPLRRRGALPGAPARPLTAAVRHGERALTRQPLGVVAVIAPALDDTLHPAFYMGMVLMGRGVTGKWGRPGAPLFGRFEYSLFDDPGLVRFYPPVTGGDATGQGLAREFLDAVQEASSQPVPRAILDPLRENILWLLGGEIPAPVLSTLRAEPPSLGTVSHDAAVRQLWGGEGFWRPYRERLMALGTANLRPAMALCAGRDRQVVLQYNPPPGAAAK